MKHVDAEGYDRWREGAKGTWKAKDANEAVGLDVALLGALGV